MDTHDLSNLRPIGTKFKIVTPPANTMSMNGVRAGLFADGDDFIIITYEVIEHVQLQHGRWGEEIRFLSMRYVAPLGWRRYCGMLTAIPPDELLELISPDWREPIPVISFTEVPGS